MIELVKYIAVCKMISGDQRADERALNTRVWQKTRAFKYELKSLSTQLQQASALLVMDCAIIWHSPDSVTLNALCSIARL